jgi:hypothetical protein
MAKKKGSNRQRTRMNWQQIVFSIVAIIIILAFVIGLVANV